MMYVKTDWIEDSLRAAVSLELSEYQSQEY